MNSDVSKLATALTMSFVVPALTYIAGRAWSKTIGGSFPNIEKTSKTLCVLMIAFSPVVIAFLGFDIVKSVWQSFPIIASAAYLFFGLTVPAVSIYFVIKIWRPKKSLEER